MEDATQIPGANERKNTGALASILRPDANEHGLVAQCKRLIWPLGVMLLLLEIFKLIPEPMLEVLIVLFVSAIVACAVSPAARTLKGYGIPKSVTILGAYLFILAVFAGVVALLIPIFIAKANLFKQQLPGLLSQLQELIARFSPDFASQLSVDSVVKELSGWIGKLTLELSKFAATVFELTVKLILILVIAFFLVSDEKRAEHLVRRFVPGDRQDRILDLGAQICQRISGFVRAQVVVAAFFGVAFGAGLWIAGVEHAFTLGLVGAIFETIPFIGGFLTVLLTVIFSMSQGWWYMFWAVVVYTIAVEVEHHVVVPKVMGKLIGDPLTVVLALFVGTKTFGVLGALISLPLVIVALAVLDAAFPSPVDQTEVVRRKAWRLPSWASGRFDSFAQRIWKLVLAVWKFLRELPSRFRQGS